MNRSLLLCAIGIVSFGAAHAQTLEDILGVPAAETDEETAPAEEPALSELDSLSKVEDDPFAALSSQQKREPVSVTLRALDKITARYVDVEVEMHQIKRFGSLELQPRTCDKRPPEEFPETTVFLEIYDVDYGERKNHLKVELPEQEVEEFSGQSSDEYEVIEAPAPEFASGEEEVTEPKAPIYVGEPAPIVAEGPQAEGTNIFKGWMFASSPALNPLEHPVYDVWVIDCKTRAVES